MEKLLTIEGMHCAHCALSVQKAVASLGGTAEISLENKTALVKSAVELSDDALREVVAQKGFEVVAISRK